MKEGLFSSSPLSNSAGSFDGNLYGRVRKIILDDTTYPDLFKEFGEWESIGMIFYESTEVPYNEENFESHKVNNAYPLFPNFKNYPLVNEIIFLINLPSFDIQSNTTITKTYYLSPINLWNGVHHNALPDNIFNNQNKKDYQSVNGGSSNRPKLSDDINLGNYFKENPKIRNLQPYEGDLIVEGRFGNSIRFSGNNKSPSWSGGEGSPIILIRNGQLSSSTDSWVPINESINDDLSSIYMTSDQSIDLSNSLKFDSFQNKPTDIKNYEGKPQIIISSGRLVFNSNKDDIIISSKNNLSLNCSKLGIDSSDIFVLSSPKIYLGSKDAKEAILLGNQTTDLLTKVFNALKNLSEALPSVGTPIPGVPNVQVAQAAAMLSETLSTLTPQLKNLRSKQNFTL